MDVLEDDQVFFRILQSRLILERFGIGLKIDDIPTVFLTAKNLFHCRSPPLVGIRLCFLTVSVNALGLPVGSAVQNFSLL